MSLNRLAIFTFTLLVVGLVTSLFPLLPWVGPAVAIVIAKFVDNVAVAEEEKENSVDWLNWIIYSAFVAVVLGGLATFVDASTLSLSLDLIAAIGLASLADLVYEAVCKQKEYNLALWIVYVAFVLVLVLAFAASSPAWLGLLGALVITQAIISLVVNAEQLRLKLTR